MAASQCIAFVLRDASLRAAPQDEVSIPSQAVRSHRETHRWVSQGLNPSYGLGVLLMAGALAWPRLAATEELQIPVVAGDSIPASLTGSPGDPQRGRAIVINRQNTCILCHPGPLAEEKFQGDLAPSLAGAGSRWSEGQLRLRLVDASRLNPETIMPSYYRLEGLDRVGRAWRGKPILSAEQIEDVVAYLVTLREAGP
jgi:sulfur-oxidizing protein SoxX